MRHRDTLSWRRRLDLDALNAASEPLTGEHDFAAYCRRKENATTVRAVTELSWQRDPEGIVVATVAADAFCQAMVRSLVGALLTVGDGRRAVDWPGSLLPRDGPGQRGGGRAAARADARRGGLPRRPGRVRRAVRRSRATAECSTVGRRRNQGDGDTEALADGGVFSIDHSSITLSRRYFCKMS